MRLCCPKCNQAVDNKYANHAEGYVYCPKCDEYFRIADHLRDAHEARRVPKPLQSDVILNRDSSSAELIIRMFQGYTVFFFWLFSGIWNAGVIITLANGNFSLFLLPFLLVGIATLGIALFTSFGQAHVRIDRQTISVTWILFSLKFSKMRQLANLAQITEEVAYRRNYQPVFAVALLFKNERKIKFGSSLTHEERKWVLGELHDITRAFRASRFTGRPNP